MIVRALPATGKSWLTANSAEWVDTDDLLEELVGEKSEGAFDKMCRTPKLVQQMSERLKSAIAAGQNVVTNFDPAVVGLKADVVVQMYPDDYIAHIKRVGRNDLLDNFSIEELRGWATSEVESPVMLMKPGQHLSDLIALLRL